VARHPPVTAPGLCYGRADVELAGSVEHAADELQETLARVATSSVVWSSPSTRCPSVARVLASRWQVDLRLDARLLEVDFGDWEGRTWSRIEGEEPAAYASWMSNWRTAAPPAVSPSRRSRRAWKPGSPSCARAPSIKSRPARRCSSPTPE